MSHFEGPKEIPSSKEDVDVRLIEQAIKEAASKLRSRSSTLSEEQATIAAGESIALLLQNAKNHHKEMPPAHFKSAFLSMTDLPEEKRRELERDDQEMNELGREVHRANLINCFTPSGVSQETAAAIVDSIILGSHN